MDCRVFSFVMDNKELSVKYSNNQYNIYESTVGTRFMRIIALDKLNTEEEQIFSEIVRYVIATLKEAKIKLPKHISLEISHHYGIKNFMKYGCVLITVINRIYCKKIIILFPGQTHPAHMHKLKEETFQVLNGSMLLTVEKNNYILNEGELFTIEHDIMHSFSSENGCVFEEISTTHMLNDSYYFDPQISVQNLTERKTIVTEWQ